MNQYYLNYLSYLHEVLGVKNILLPTEPSTEFPPWVFLSNQIPFSIGESELFLKMIAAMKLQDSDYQLMNVNQVEVANYLPLIQNAKTIICFHESLFQYLKLQFAHANVFLVSHPRELLKNANLKKTAWEELKRALQSMAQLTSPGAPALSTIV